MAQSRKQSESEGEKHRAQDTVTGLLSLAPFGCCPAVLQIMQAK